jgi:hypothetical protein
MPGAGAVNMMSANCPECNLELNGQIECARCAQVLTAATFAQTGDTDARDLSYAGVPVAPDDVADTEPGDGMPAADEFSSFPFKSVGESADAQEHAGVDDSPFEVEGDDWAGEGSGGDALPDEAYQMAEEDVPPPTAAESYSNTSVGGRGSVGTIINSTGGPLSFTPRHRLRRCRRMTSER